MVTIKNIEISVDSIGAFCSQWKITELALFGSVLREDFGPESDIDVLVTFEPNPGWSIFDHLHMEEELEAIFGRKVDLVSRQAIEENHNPIRRKVILESAKVIHVSV